MFTFKPLFKILIDRDIKEKVLAQSAGISPATLCKMKKDNSNININVLASGGYWIYNKGDLVLHAQCRKKLTPKEARKQLKTIPKFLTVLFNVKKENKNEKL